MLELFRASAERAPRQVALRYFDGELTIGQLDRASDALALALLDRGFGPGERLALYVQNNPGFVIGLLGAWKAGGTAVAVNPMNKGRELTFLLADSGAKALLCLDTLYLSVARDVIASRQSRVDTVITTSELDLLGIVSAYAGQRPGSVSAEPGDVAVLTYTSGTTGRPKGAMNTHETMV